MRKSLSIVIATLLFWFTFSTLLVQAEVKTVEKDVKPLPIVVDGTDYPTLYLTTPNLQGEAIWMVQARLREMGFDIEPNGFYDVKTFEFVKLFQTANHLTADGVMTRPVWESLMVDLEGEACMTSAAPTSAKVRIEIDVVKHSLNVFKEDTIIRTFPVGVGKSKTPTPLGEWKVVHKGVGWGNGFGTRWMGLNVPWGIYGIHGTNKPYSIGSSQSHGCIRMQNRDVEALYPLIPIGTMVKIMEDGQIFPKNFKPVHLYKKCSGQQVVYLQSRLKEKGIVFDNADGRFGSMTELALKYYQAWHGLEVTGETNDTTYKALGMIK